MENKQKLKEYSFNVKNNVGWKLCPQMGRIIGNKKCENCKYIRHISITGMHTQKSISIKILCAHPDADRDYTSPYTDLFPDLSDIYSGTKLFLASYGEVTVSDISRKQAEVGIEDHPITVAIPRDDMRAGVRMQKSVQLSMLSDDAIAEQFITEECYDAGILPNGKFMYERYMMDGRKQYNDRHPTLFKSAEQHFKYWEAVSKRDKGNER